MSKKIGFLSFGHWTESRGSQVRSAADSLVQSVELAAAAEKLGATARFFAFTTSRASSVRRSRCLPPLVHARIQSRSARP